MIVVADATCLIGLARIDKLDILKTLFGKIYIPEAVRKEIIDKGKDRPGAQAVNQAKWIITQKIKDKFAVRLLEKDLDSGEAETIVLAQELKADYIILDDKQGRDIAELVGLSVIGTVGILLLAKEKMIISDFKAVLNALRESGFRIRDDLYYKVLKDVQSKDS